ncbi:MAG: Fe-S protein assembly co-chaperone HscB [Pseudohongiellaceae bacterium]
MSSPADNYFKWFTIPAQYELDPDALAERYRQLQAELHPDKFAAADEQQRLHAVQMTSLLNEAYATLKSPLQRAAYLLQLHGEDVSTVNQNDLPAELLLEQIELRERLDELPKDDSALTELDAMKAETRQKLTAKQSEFSQALQDNQLAAARIVFHELQFLEKLFSEINAGEEQRLGY